jgi:hypothetical protein
VDNKEVGREGEGKYKLSAGVLDDRGIPTEGIAKEWLDYERKLIEEEYRITPNGSEVLNHVILYNKLNNQTADPDLAEAVSEGRIASYLDLVNYNANLVDESGKTHLEQLKNFTIPNVPEVVASEIAELIYALCAKESC